MVQTVRQNTHQHLQRQCSMHNLAWGDWSRSRGLVENIGSAETECSVSTLASSVTLQRKSWKIYTSTSSTCEMTIGKCSIGDPGTSPSRSCSLKPWRAILFTPFFRTHNILVFHGGDVFTHAKTGGMLSKALKSPGISSDLFQELVCQKLSRVVEKKKAIYCLF